MSKAITGLVEIGAAVGIGAFAMVTSGAGLSALPILFHELAPLLAAGLSSEIGALADALTSNRGQNITTRQPAAFRQIVYGTQRVGGTMVYESTTGSSHDQYNMVIVLATHEIYAIENIYLDGRQVYFQGSGGGWSVRNGYGFGGVADSNDHVGPDGQTYNFGGTGHSGIYIEARYGDQPAGDYITGLTANDPNWAPGVNGTPTLQGCAYLYVKVEANTNLFPQMPEIRVTLKGKQVLDPRTGQTTYSSNPALCMADYISDPDWGVDDVTVNQAQLIAAANLCDEQVSCAAGQEARYAYHWHFDTSTGAGDVLSTMRDSMAAKFSRIGGEWYIFPGAAVAPVLALTADQLTDRIQWKPAQPYRDRFNRVRGTYTAPNFPFNIAGDLYDSNGWANGRIQNNFPFAFQATNYPEYAEDTLHGYAADQYLTEDGGHVLVKELGLPAVLSVSQAQRLAKIALRRNRMQQGTGTLKCNLAALQLQPGDTFTLTCPQMGWVNKLLEVTSFEFAVSQTADGPLIGITLGVAEYSADIYADFQSGEELTVYAVPSAPTQITKTPAPPTNMTVTSLVDTQPDGTLLRTLEVSWDTPQDPYVAQIQVQFQRQGSSTWYDGGTVSAKSNATLLGNIVSGVTYNVRICSVRANGATSGWVEADGIATTSLSPIVYQGQGIANSQVTVSGSTVTIDPISTTLGSTPVSYFPSGTTVTGATPGQTNYVYVVDPTYSGGTPTPVVTTDQSAYLGKVGYVLLATLAA